VGQLVVLVVLLEIWKGQLLLAMLPLSVKVMLYEKLELAHGAGCHSEVAVAADERH